jgi:soluble lytic murein transglycosylase
MREESSFIEDIESYAGALGLMQLMPATALGHDSNIEGRATPERLKEAEVNIRVGVDHLFWLAKRFDDHPVLIAAAYNAGAGAVSKWLKRYGHEEVALFVEDIPPLQTRDYTKRVIGSYAAYQWLGGEKELDNRIRSPAKK